MSPRDGRRLPARKDLRYREMAGILLCRSLIAVINVGKGFKSLFVDDTVIRAHTMCQLRTAISATSPPTCRD